MEKSFISRACEIAREGSGSVSPNPLVGALVVKGHKIIGEGFHKAFGSLHAEIEAMSACNESLEGATLYCNLEPCSTVYPDKKHPPCCDSIIASGIKKVVIGQLDPNPHVAGHGVKLLSDAGISTHVLREHTDSYYLNRVFNNSFGSKRPWVHLKWAQSLDGTMALFNGESKWITDETCRSHAHGLRNEYDAIVVGRNTLLVDNPELSVRYGYKSSIRAVIMDPKLELDTSLNVFKNNPLVVCNRDLPEEQRRDYPYELLPLSGDVFNLEELLEALKKCGVASLLVEGGAKLLTDFYKSGLWDEISIYIAPKLLGNGLKPIGNLDINHPSESISLFNKKITPLGDHMLFTALKEELCSPV